MDDILSQGGTATPAVAARLAVIAAVAR